MVSTETDETQYAFGWNTYLNEAFADWMRKWGVRELKYTMIQNQIAVFGEKH